MFFQWTSKAEGEEDAPTGLPQLVNQGTHPPKTLGTGPRFLHFIPITCMELRKCVLMHCRLMHGYWRFQRQPTCSTFAPHPSFSSQIITRPACVSPYKNSVARSLELLSFINNANYHNCRTTKWYIECLDTFESWPFNCHKV